MKTIMAWIGLAILFATLQGCGYNTIQAQDEAAAGLAREQPVEDRRPGVADMEPARRRRREADRDGHVASR